MMKKHFWVNVLPKKLLAYLIKQALISLLLRKTVLLNRVFGKDVIDPETGEIIVEQGTVFTEDHLDLLQKFKSIAI